jgi:hypothetical protein
MNVERTVNLITGLDQINGNHRFVKLKVGVTLRGKSLGPSRRRSMELSMLKIGFPIISFQRGLKTRLGFEERPQQDICGRKLEERHDAKRALASPGSRK